MTTAFSRIRSIMEVPILDEKKWMKIPNLVSDSFLVDLEDSVPPAEKPRARELAAEYLNKPEFFGNRMIIARSNSLATEWGREDLVALGKSGIEYLCYPKTESAADLRAAQAILREHGADPVLLPIVETARGMLAIEEIASVENVGGLTLGIMDLATDVGMTVFDDAGEYNAGLMSMLVTPVLAARANDIAVFSGAFVQNMSDFEEVRRRVRLFRQMGYTGLFAIYPPHLKIILEVFSPSEKEIAEAEDVVARYEAARARGEPAVLREDGTTILIFDYTQAKKLLDRVSDFADGKKTG
ncbi:MAG: CoA ester lyase [Flavobacteriaceae bacterium]